MNSLADELPGDSEPINRERSEIARAAQTDAPVLLVGETGTGKELVARLIHQLSNRKGRPFVAINMAAIPGSLATAELVGHTKGAFTGAVLDRPGVFQLANHGSIFLDEITEAPRDVQATLLSILDTRSVRPLGAADNIKLDVRVIAATSRDMKTLTEVGDFRPDLYRRIAVIEVRLAPLRERPADIPALRGLSSRSYHLVQGSRYCWLQAHLKPSNATVSLAITKSLRIFSRRRH